MDAVEQFIATIYPECATMEVLRVLRRIGVKTLKDLLYVEPKDFHEIGLTDVEQNRLVQQIREKLPAWSESGETTSAVSSSKKHTQLHLEHSVGIKDCQTEEQQQDLHQQLQEMDHQLQQLNLLILLKDRQLQWKDKQLQQVEQQVQQLRCGKSEISLQPWVISSDELIVTKEVLGKGAYGVVKIALFRGLRVAAKYLHRDIISDYNVHMFTREMNTSSQFRHPNLVTFIGAILSNPPIIITELMVTSLRAAIFKQPLSRTQIKSISGDVACGLNYLHEWKPDPFIHRDVSSPNVLMKPSGADSWEAKISDYGSANSMRMISAASVAPGNPAYSAPEATFPNRHTPKMDVYSFGVLLTEMTLRKQPEMTVESRAEQAGEVQWHAVSKIIQECLSLDPDERPAIQHVLVKLRAISM